MKLYKITGREWYMADLGLTVTGDGKVVPKRERREREFKDPWEYDMFSEWADEEEILGKFRAYKNNPYIIPGSLKLWEVELNWVEKEVAGE